MKQTPFTRKKFYSLLILSFAIPTFFAWYDRELLFPAIFVACIALFYLVYSYEKKMQEKVALLVRNKVEALGSLSHALLQKSEEQVTRLKGTLEETKRSCDHQIDLLQSSVLKAKERIEELELEIETRREETRESRLEFEDLKQEYKLLQQERDGVSKEYVKQMSHKEGLLSEYQQTIHEQRTIIEKKQRYITKLEGKVHDLMYEIRSLLQLDERAEPLFQTLPETKEDLTKYLLPPQQLESTTQYDLSLILQRYLTHTEKFHGLGTREGKSSRFLDENNAINQRQLFDFFREEACGIIFVYSQIEGRLLFMNQQVKMLLGWSPEKLVKDFTTLVVSGLEAWKQGLKLLERQAQIAVEISLRDKEGEVIVFKSLMGAVADGPFQHHVIGILTPSVSEAIF